MPISPSTQKLLDDAANIIRSEGQTNIYFQAAAILGRTDGLAIEQQALLVVPVLLNQLRALDRISATYAALLDVVTSTPKTEVKQPVEVLSPANCRYCDTLIYETADRQWAPMDGTTYKCADGWKGHAPRQAE